jgi:hypothetical protein
VALCAKKMKEDMFLLFSLFFRLLIRPSTAPIRTSTCCTNWCVLYLAYTSSTNFLKAAISSGSELWPMSCRG